MNKKAFFACSTKPRQVARFFFIGLSLLTACSGDPSAEEGKATSKERPPVPVTVGTVLSKNVAVQVTAVGNVEAYSTVNIKSRVSGELVGVHFQEGQEVKEGDLLFTIDKAPYEVALKEAQARLERDQALARKAQDDVRRNMPLAARDFVSQQAYAQYKSVAEAAEALVKADEATIENLQLQLSYCTIRVTIHEIQPIYVTFALPEKHLGVINRAMKEKNMEVQVSTPENSSSREPLKGTVTFVNNTVDVSTATIRLKATFQNKDGRLWPGQTVNVVLTLSSQQKAVVAPSQAIQNSQSGPYAFVVKPDSTAEMRQVIIARNTNGEAVIENGLNPGETVVTDGQLLLTPGAKVTLKEQNSNQKEGAKK